MKSHRLFIAYLLQGLLLAQDITLHMINFMLESDSLHWIRVGSIHIAQSIPRRSAGKNYSVGAIFT